MIKLPKNIRQIGTCGGSLKIYMEDYVETWLRRYAENALTECVAAVFIGEYQEMNGEQDLFLYGAIQADCISEGKIRLTQRVWTEVYEDIRKYFPEGEVVGWYLGGPGFLLEADSVRRVHGDHFAGRDKVLLQYDTLEREEAFYVLESGEMKRQSGYYIYYDRNEGMQSYMLDHRQSERSIEADFEDNITKRIRATVEENKDKAAAERVGRIDSNENVKAAEGAEKFAGATFAAAKKSVKGRKIERPVTEKTENPESVSGSMGQKSGNPSGMKGLVYTAGTLAAAVLLIIGASVLNRYERMRGDSDSLPVVGGNVNAGNASQEGTSDPSQSQSTQEADATSESNSENDQTQEGTTESARPPEPTPEPASEPQPTPSAAPTPVPTEAPSEEDKEPSPPPSQESTETVVEPTYSYYTVKKGDTLLGIVLNLYHSAEYLREIKELNDLKNEDLIYIGQVLTIPEPIGE